MSAPIASFPFNDPQTWIVTALAIGAVWILARRAIGPRRKSGCGSCASSPAKPKLTDKTAPPRP